jgi:hypothetical protein
MALRSLARYFRPLAGPGARLIQSAPTVFDKMVQFYVIDKSGARHTVRGLEGITLSATLREYGARAALPHAVRHEPHGCVACPDQSRCHALMNYKAALLYMAGVHPGSTAHHAACVRCSNPTRSSRRL